MKTCFSIMPFGHGFEDIDQIIEDAACECGMDYVRGDRRNQPGSILPQIVADIQNAVVVVADISGHNPNVFYELGIAHQLKGADRVVIITQSSQQSPYDVHEFRQLDYRHTEAGRAELRAKLPGFLRAAMEAAADQEIWKVIRGRMSRTRLLVRDLQRITASADDLSHVTIRTVSGLSSLAISDHEPPDPDEGAEYNRLLGLERDALRAILMRGGKLKAILNPPRRFAQAMLPERLRLRYERLLGLFEGRSDVTHDPRSAADDIAAMGQCEFTLTPVPMPNQLIVGDTVAYEGMKRGGSRGFEMTHSETNRDAVRDLIAQFDRLFEESQRQLQRSHPPDGRVPQQIRSFYEECIQGTRRES